jgi:hypothetical protein
MKLGVALRVTILLFAMMMVFCGRSYAQTTNATVTGQISDQSGRLVPDATVVFTNINTGVPYTTRTNAEGIYSLPTLQPGVYRANITKDGFKSIVKADIEVHVQDQVSINFSLQIGSVSETVTVEAGSLVINTTDATVSTVVDRQFAENLPMNGRSFQTLIELAPGVVVTPVNSFDSGQFSVNGQRASSNYWMVDGVSANIGVASAGSAFPGNGLGGAAGSVSALGGTNSLVSVDAMQEFRIQTSTYAPEFGRTPGAQISIVTRSGTNGFHGTVFDYLRNDFLDANNWFNDAVTPTLPKAKERQNDFGGTFSGPLVKDKTFFFFSYEGLRLRLPETELTDVPDINARQNATALMKAYINAFPLPNGPEVPSLTGAAELNASFTNPASLDAYSLRIDHKLSTKINLFGRYNYSPSALQLRGFQGTESLSSVASTNITTQTGTVGATWSMSPSITDDIRFNYSRASSTGSLYLDSFDGAIPLTSLPFPSGYDSQNALFAFDILEMSNGLLITGKKPTYVQKQFNLVDNFSVQRGSHGLKFGTDFRQLSPTYSPQPYYQAPFFLDVPSAESGSVFLSVVESSRGADLSFHNLGLFAQDTWHALPRLTLTYGLRWDVDFAPSSTSGPSLNAVTGFNLDNLANLALAPAGTPPFKTTYGNIAPRIGVAYQISQNQRWQTVLRGGFGVFYDLATSEIGNNITGSFYPFGASNEIFGPIFGGTATLPLNAADAAPPPITPASLSLPGATLYATDPNLKLPYSLQWNLAFEQALGNQQSVSVSYIGSAGRRLLQTAYVESPNPSISSAQLVANAATSDYDGLQLQFQRRLSRGLQALASYSWSHSLDNASAGSLGNEANTLAPLINPKANWGPSDFDIRNAFSAGLTYDLPSPKGNALTRALFRGWSTENFVLARSAPPVNLYYALSGTLLNAGNVAVRPDVVGGIPLYLYGSQCMVANGGAPCPGGKAINFTPGAVAGGCPDGSQSVGPFCPPPADANGNPLRQGNLGRNALRGFGASQWDFAVHRNFPIRESLILQFRAEMFNVLNHPNFAPPVANLNDTSQFGLSTQMLGQYLAGTGSTSGLASLYQIGGPRSIQLALKLSF